VPEWHEMDGGGFWAAPLDNSFRPERTSSLVEASLRAQPSAAGDDAADQPAAAAAQPEARGLFTSSTIVDEQFTRFYTPYP
jgi:hypothetical protein